MASRPTHSISDSKGRRGQPIQKSHEVEFPNLMHERNGEKKIGTETHSWGGIDFTSKYRNNSGGQRSVRKKEKEEFLWGGERGISNLENSEETLTNDKKKKERGEADGRRGGKKRGICSVTEKKTHWFSNRGGVRFLFYDGGEGRHVRECVGLK